jgi:hypothetical protein
VHSWTGSLAVGASETAYNCSLAGITANMTNTAIASGTGPLGTTVTAQATADVTVTSPTPAGQITPTATTCNSYSAGTATTLSALSYGLKGTTINNVSPGVFFYWIKVTGGGTYTITQSSVPTLKPFSIANGSFVYNASCTKVSDATITQDATTGTVTVIFSGTGTFYIGIKYDATSIKGATASGSYLYTFAAGGIPASSHTITLSPS